MSQAKHGKYLVVEGSDGVGKTTQRNLLKDRLQSWRRPAVAVADTGGTPLADRIRELILDPSLQKQPETELDLFTICRRELIHQVIQPSIQAGSTIISDRNWFSSIAYQGFGRGLDVNKIIEKTSEATGGYFMPDGIVILDVPLEVTEERIRTSRPETDWFEQEGREFFEKVRQGYHWLAERYDVELIDGTPSPEVVGEAIWNSLGKLAVQ